MNIAIDFGGTNIKAGLVHEGVVLAKTSIPAYSEGGLLPRLQAVEQTVKRMLDNNNVRLIDCTGIGLATPGFVDSINKTLLSINGKYEDAVGYLFEGWAREAFSLPLCMENDARAALLGEVAFGVAFGETDAVMMTFGTGIGTAAIINGQVLRGKHFQAGVLGGHLTTDINGNVCNCGNQGCLEAQSSHWALPYLANSYPQFDESKLSQYKEINYQAILESVLSGDAVASGIFENLIKHWSAGIVNLIHAYDPEMVVLSGGLMKSSAIIVPLLEARVRQLCWTPWGEVRFAVAADPDASVLIGVSHMVNESLF